MEYETANLKEFTAPSFKNTTFRLDRPSQYLTKKASRLSDGYETLRKSMINCTVYIGKLSQTTKEEQLYELFRNCGEIKSIILGLNKITNQPAGFCFIIFKDPKGALASVKYLNHTILDGNKIEIDLDPGFEEGRQWGRGSDGGQRTYVKNFRNQQNYRGRFRGGYRSAPGGGRPPYDDNYYRPNDQYQQQEFYPNSDYNNQGSLPPHASGSLPPHQQGGWN